MSIFVLLFLIFTAQPLLKKKKKWQVEDFEHNGWQLIGKDLKILILGRTLKTFIKHCNKFINFELNSIVSKLVQ